jgi:betaine-aldehyde dehydrogenase
MTAQFKEARMPFDLGAIPRGLYYGGAWHEATGGHAELIDPATGASLGRAGLAGVADVDTAVAAAKDTFRGWRGLKPFDRAVMLRAAAQRLRENAEELAWLDAVNCGNPVKDMIADVHAAARRIDLFAGLGTEIKGDVMPAGDGVLSLTIREPYGVCARIVAYNHPLLFAAGKLAAPLATGTVLILKPAQQAPLSALRMIELIGPLFPPGVVNLLNGGVACGEALTAHPDIPVVTLVGSAPVGRAIARGGAERLKHVGLELGGKNAMVVYPDADRDRAIRGAIQGMNFSWCGQSCGSTSRLFLHDAVYDDMLGAIIAGSAAFRPGLPTDPATNMGAIISRAQFDKIMRYIEIGKAEGARLVLGGGSPADPALANGFFIEPTIFTDVTMGMTIAREEIFGPVLSVFRWSDEAEMLKAVNAVEYGLTAAVYTRDIATAHRLAGEIEAGFVSINNNGMLPLGAPFGGYKMSGIGRDSSIEEMFSFTQIKNVTLTL